MYSTKIIKLSFVHSLLKNVIKTTCLHRISIFTSTYAKNVCSISTTWGCIWYVLERYGRGKSPQKVIIIWYIDIYDVHNFPRFANPLVRSNWTKMHVYILSKKQMFCMRNTRDALHFITVSRMITNMNINSLGLFCHENRGHTIWSITFVYWSLSF